jgi:hypothetical protein
MRSQPALSDAFLADRVFYTTLEARRLLYALVAASGGEA